MTSQQLSADDAAIILELLPERIRAAMLDRANEIEYPIEAVVEMAIAILRQKKIKRMLLKS
jgi:hypothetical protein